MPIYDLECKKCGNKVEALMSGKERHMPPCPKCGTEMKKQISQTNFILKGSGWYRDGYTSKRG